MVGFVAMIVTAVTVAFLLLSGKSSRVGATPAAGPSYQAAEKQVPSDPQQAERTPAVQTRMELEPLALYQNADTPADTPNGANDAAADPIQPARLEPKPAPDTSPKGSEQALYKSRRALETVDAREFLRRTTR